MAWLQNEDAVVQITTTVRFKIWVNHKMIDESGSDTLTGVAHEFLLLHVNDHPVIQADIEGPSTCEVVKEGSFVEEPVMCENCGTLYFTAFEVNHIDAHERCSNCPESDD